jgi:hypothetical protein
VRSNCSGGKKEAIFDVFDFIYLYMYIYGVNVYLRYKYLVLVCMYDHGPVNIIGPCVRLCIDHNKYVESMYSEYVLCPTKITILRHPFQSKSWYITTRDIMVGR